MLFVLIWPNPVDLSFSLFLCAVAGDPSSKLAFANSFSESESDPRFESAIREVVSQNHIPRHSTARLVSSQNKTKKKHLFEEARSVFETGVSLLDPHCEI
jgi:hypothetical protein